MNRLKEAIEGKDRWGDLNTYISLVQSNIESNSNVALDGAKSILESISKTILEDKSIPYESDSKVGFLVKQAFNSLPVFTKISEEDLENARSILGSFENIARVIGEFRNNHGFFSHGQDLQSEKFDRYLVELAISSSDLLASFLIVCHAEDLKDRSRIYYEENDEFNRYIDDTSEENPVVQGIQLIPSKTLYTDPEAYKDQLLAFVNEKEILITRLEESESFVSTRSAARDSIPMREYMTTDEIRRLVKACSDNPQIYRILGHGFTKNLFSWIREEKSHLLSSAELSQFQKTFDYKMF